MVVYFTGTGNSRYCAEMLAEKLGDKAVDSFSYIKNKIAAELISDKPWVFVCPTYAWQMPKIFADFIRTGCFSGNKNAYFLLTCGGDIGNAGEYIVPICNDVGLTYKGVMPVVMPENYVAMFSVPDEEKCRRMITDAEATVERAAELISSESDFPLPKLGFAARQKSGVVNRGFYKFYVSAKKFRTTDRCVGCGKCAELCPLGNITVSDGRPVWGEKCTHCMACICLCPEEAIEYGITSVGKRRYRCPDYNGSV